MFEKLKAVIEENLSVEGAEITENTDFKEDLGADSMSIENKKFMQKYQR